MAYNTRKEDILYSEILPEDLHLYINLIDEDCHMLSVVKVQGQVRFEIKVWLKKEYIL